MSRCLSYYLEDILENITDIYTFVGKISYDEFFSDRKTRNAVVRSLEVIGEAVKHIPTSITKNYPEIPWRNIRTMRNLIAHEYFGIDYSIVWQTIQRLSALHETVAKILSEINKTQTDRDSEST